jgi:hypothetical protein
MDILEELTQAAEALRRQDERRNQQLIYRDELIRKSLKAGKTWAEVQEAASVGPRIISIALKRD